MQDTRSAFRDAFGRKRERPPGGWLTAAVGLRITPASHAPMGEGGVGREKRGTSDWGRNLSSAAGVMAFIVDPHRCTLSPKPIV